MSSLRSAAPCWRAHCRTRWHKPHHTPVNYSWGLHFSWAEMDVSCREGYDGKRRRERERDVIEVNSFAREWTEISFEYWGIWVCNWIWVIEYEEVALIKLCRNDHIWEMNLHEWQYFQWGKCFEFLSYVQIKESCQKLIPTLYKWSSKLVCCHALFLPRTTCLDLLQGSPYFSLQQQHICNSECAIPVILSNKFLAISAVSLQ